MESQVSFKEHKYRYVIFIIYVFSAIVGNLPCNTFASLNSTIQRLFQISIIEVSLNVLIFPITHTLFAFPCNWITNKKGIKVSFYLASLLIVGGMWLRTFLSKERSYICLLGSFFSAIGGIFLFNNPSRIAITWFKSQSVPLITFIGVLSNLVSMTIGIALPGIFINSKSTAEDIINFFRLEAIIATIPLCLLAIFIKQKPADPPSPAALAFQTKKNYLEIVKSIFKNVQYVKLSISMALNFGVCIGYLAILEQVLVAIDYPNPSQSISLIGASGILAAIFSNIIYSSKLKKTKQFKKILILATLGDFIGMAVMNLSFLYYIDKWWQIILTSILFCFNHLALPSIYILFSTQIAFPIDQASIAGYMIAIGQTFGFLMGLFFASILDEFHGSAKLVFYITTGCFLLSLLLALTIKQDLRKSHFEEEQLLKKDKSQGRISLLSE